MQKKLRICVKTICVLLYLGFVIYNANTNAEFWSASAVNCITIGVAVVISYHFVQKQSDRRKQKDIVLELIQKIQLSIGQKGAYDFTGQGKEEITMRTRDLDNKIHILELMKDEFSISADVEFIRSKFDEYNVFIGNHIENLKYLLESQKDLKRPLDLIDSKLVEAALKLYK